MKSGSACLVVSILFFSCMHLGQDFTFPEDIRTSIIEGEAHAEKGFDWPFIIYVPRSLRQGAVPLLCISNNTPSPNDSYEVHYENAKRKIMQYRHLADSTGLPLVIFAIPRFETMPPQADFPGADAWLVDSQALNRNSMLTNIPSLRRMDLQFIAMLTDAGERLKDRNIALTGKIIPFGFSSSGTFASRFTLLHPELVEMVVAGSPGGWFTLPLSEYEGKKLRYPVGISDVRKFLTLDFDAEAYRRVPKFFFTGTEDTDDAVPYLDAYAYEDRVAIQEIFGAQAQERYRIIERILKENGMQVIFTFYKGMQHSISRQAWDDIIAFINEGLDAVHD